MQQNEIDPPNPRADEAAQDASNQTMPAPGAADAPPAGVDERPAGDRPARHRASGQQAQVGGGEGGFGSASGSDDYGAKEQGKALYGQYGLALPGHQGYQAEHKQPVGSKEDPLSRDLKPPSKQK